ncbi:MAG: long-chain fatty acid--CoA ligase [Actinomycetota bacterium]
MNLASMLAASAARVPDKPALVFRDRPISYAQLDAVVSQASGAFAGARVGAGDRVAIIAGNVPEFVYALFGAWRAGAVAVPLNVMLTAPELRSILADSGARVLVCEMGYLPTVLEIRDRLPDLQTVMVVAGPPVPQGTVSFEEALGRAGPPPGVEASEDDLALLQYTSGTTAEPKAAMLTHGNLLSNLEQTQQVPALSQAQDDVVFLVLPMFHIYGLNVALNLTLREGATGVLMERFHPAEALEVIRRHGVTIVPGAPPMYYSWLELDDEVKQAFESVRLAVSGAAPLPAEVLESFRVRFAVTVWEGYGLTEASPSVSSNAAGPRAKAWSVGLPLPGVEVRLVDHDGGNVEDDDPGEILIRGPNVFRGYWHRDEETEAVFADRWLRTGDVAYRDEDGYLFLVDRTKDLVIVSGFNVYPKEVEDALAAHPDVEEAAVIGVPDERTGEAVKAFVVAREGAGVTPESLLEHAGRSLARFKIPREIEIVPELPKHATGKVLRRALRGEEVLGGETP